MRLVLELPAHEVYGILDDINHDDRYWCWRAFGIQYMIQRHLFRHAYRDHPRVH